MRRLATGLVALSLALVAAGCGDSGGGGSTTSNSNTSSASESGGDAVAWADKVCSSIKDDVAALTKTPDLDLSDPQAFKDGVVTFLGTLETSLDGMAGAVDDAGPPPVEGGADAVTSFKDQIATAKDAVTSAKAKIEAAPANDPAALQQAATEAMNSLSSLGDLDPTSSLAGDKELKAAYDKAKSCQELEIGTSSTPTT